MRKAAILESFATETEAHGRGGYLRVHYRGWATQKRSKTYWLAQRNKQSHGGLHPATKKQKKKRGHSRKWLSVAEKRIRESDRSTVRSIGIVRVRGLEKYGGRKLGQRYSGGGGAGAAKVTTECDG